LETASDAFELETLMASHRSSGGFPFLKNDETREGGGLRRADTAGPDGSGLPVCFHFDIGCPAQPIFDANPFP